MSDRLPEGFAELQFHYFCEGDSEAMITSLGIKLAVGDTASNFDAMFQAWYDAIRVNVQTSYTLGPSVIQIGTATEDNLVYNGTGTEFGLLAGEAMPPNVSVLVRKLGTTPGRRGRGRMYLPGYGMSGILSSGEIQSVTLGLFQDNIDDALTGVAAASEDFQGFFLYHGSAPFDPSPINSFPVQRKLATQRRRLRP